MGQLNSISVEWRKCQSREREASRVATRGMVPTELTAGRPQTAACDCRALTLPQSVRTCAGPAAHCCASSGRESVGVSWGGACLSLLRSRQTLWDTIRRGETLHLWDEKGGWFGRKRILEGNIQAKGKVYDMYGGWGRRHWNRTDRHSGNDLDFNSGDNCLKYWRFLMIFFSMFR